MMRWYNEEGWLYLALAIVLLCSCAPKPSAKDREILWALEQFQRTTSAIPEHDALEAIR